MAVQRSTFLIAFTSTLLISHTLAVNPLRFGHLAPAPSPYSSEPLPSSSAVISTATTAVTSLPSPSTFTSGISAVKGFFTGSLFANKAEAEQEADPILLKLCGVTEKPDLCVETIRAVNIASVLDPVAAITAEIEACMNQTEAVLAKVAQFISDSGVSSHRHSALETCKDNYDDVKDSLLSAKEAVAQKDVGTLNSMLSAVISDIVTCDDSFAEFPDVQSILDKEETQRVYNLAGNCLDMVKLVN